MLVLGIVVVCFLIVHLIQFWAKMQLPEVLGLEGEYPGAAGTLFIQQAFSCPVTLIVYLIGFAALWFHMTHGFWSMCQSSGLNNGIWLNRLKNIGCVWATVVVLLFAVEAIVFTVQAKKNYYTTNPALIEQYYEMAPACNCEGCEGCESCDECGCATGECIESCARCSTIAKIAAACNTECAAACPKAAGCTKNGVCPEGNGCDKAACGECTADCQKACSNGAECANAGQCEGDCPRNTASSVSDNFNEGTF